MGVVTLQFWKVHLELSCILLWTYFPPVSWLINRRDFSVSGINTLNSITWTQNTTFSFRLSPCVNYAPRHEGILWEWRYSSTHSLTSALDGGEWSASRLSRFTPRERAPGTHWIWGWVGPRAIPDAVMKRKIPSPRKESNRRTPIVQPVAQRYTDWAITAPYFRFGYKRILNLHMLHNVCIGC
jgi:hypothetical protein